jgi:galactose mutarotase-like enzyme
MHVTSNEPSTPVKTSSLGQFTVLTMENSKLRVSFIPELGAKMNSLKSRITGREFLLPPAKPYRPAAYGAEFAEFDTSGFDECFPTVSACFYPDSRLGGQRLPDHGDLWSIPWRYDARGAELFFEAEGRSLPCVFRKSVQLDGNSVVLKYELENTSDSEFSWLWSAHPLLAAEAGCRVVLPHEVTDLFVNWSRDDRLGEFGDTCGWPIARTNSGADVDLSLLTSSKAGTADKLFTPLLTTGECGVLYESGESLFFRFTPSAVLYVGLWICQGGWPTPANGHFTLALEPCTGRPDSLEVAINSAECRVLGEGTKLNWDLRLEVNLERKNQLGE